MPAEYWHRLTREQKRRAVREIIAGTVATAAFLALFVFLILHVPPIHVFN